MAIPPLAFHLIRELYTQSDDKQKASFVKWLTTQERTAMPLELCTIEEFLAARSGGLLCPRCGGSHLVRNGKHNGRQRFVCRDCKRTIGMSNETPFFSSKKPWLTWLTFIRCMDQHLPLRASAKKCNISLPTAWAWRRKFRVCMVGMLRQVLAQMIDKGLIDENWDLEELEERLDEAAHKHFRPRKLNPLQKFLKRQNQYYYK